MTKKLTHNEKMFSKLTSGLNATWNCDNNCGNCIFKVTDEKMLAFLKQNTYSMMCGATAMRELARKFFSHPRAQKFLERI